MFWPLCYCNRQEEIRLRSQRRTCLKAHIQNTGLWAQEATWEEAHKDATSVFPIYKATGTGLALEDREMSKKQES